MKRLLNSIGVSAVLLSIASGGCTNTRGHSAALRPASGQPEHFVPVGNAALVVGTSQSPMSDPRDETKIILVRSTREWGDYQVPPGRYGVGKGELLRLETGTGRVLGIVKQ